MANDFPFVLHYNNKFSTPMPTDLSTHSPPPPICSSCFAVISLTCSTEKSWPCSFALDTTSSDDFAAFSLPWKTRVSLHFGEGGFGLLDDVRISRVSATIATVCCNVFGKYLLWLILPWIKVFIMGSSGNWSNKRPLLWHWLTSWNSWQRLGSA